MSYINTVNAIRSAALAVNPSGTFHNGRWDDFSVESITDVVPVIQLFPITIRESAPADIFDTADVLMRFMDQDSPDSSMTKREQIVARMDDLATAFINSLRLQFKKFEPRNVQREPDYRIIQGTFSGIIVRFSYLSFPECVTYTGFGEENVSADQTVLAVVFDAKPGARYTMLVNSAPAWITPVESLFLTGNTYQFIVQQNNALERSATIIFTSLDTGEVLALTVNQAAS